MKLPSQFQVGDSVLVFGQAGFVEGVTFRKGKVTYDVALDMGGETIRNVDSTFLEAPAV